MFHIGFKNLRGLMDRVELITPLSHYEIELGIKNNNVIVLSFRYDNKDILCEVLSRSKITFRYDIMFERYVGSMDELKDIITSIRLDKPSSKLLSVKPIKRHIKAA